MGNLRSLRYISRSQGRSYHEGQTFIEEYWYANAYLVEEPAPLSSVCQVPT